MFKVICPYCKHDMLLLRKESEKLCFECSCCRGQCYIKIDINFHPPIPSPNVHDALIAGIMQFVVGGD